nr:RNA-dependent RNA polymerase [Flumine nodavirus 7]
MVHKVFRQRGTTANGVRYDAGWGTRSGSPITTDGNTMINAFIVYCSFRELGYTPAEARRKLEQGALLVGDDGAVSNEGGLVAALESVVLDLGLKVKCAEVATGERVTFCGRVYPNLVNCLTSMQDPLRTIPKLHLTSNKCVSIEQAAANRAHGYLATDSKTPIIGTWARKVIELSGNLKVKGATREEQYKLSNAHQQLDIGMLNTAMATILQISEGELKALDESIGNAKALDQLPVILENTYKHKIRAVVGGEVVGPEPRVVADGQNHEQSKRVESSVPQMADASRRLNKKAGQGSDGKTGGVPKEIGIKRLTPRQPGPGKSPTGNGVPGRSDNRRGPHPNSNRRGGRGRSYRTSPPVPTAITAPVTTETVITTAVIH